MKKKVSGDMALSPRRNRLAIPIQSLKKRKKCLPTTSLQAGV